MSYLNVSKEVLKHFEDEAYQFSEEPEDKLVDIGHYLVQSKLETGALDKDWVVDTMINEGMVERGGEKKKTKTKRRRSEIEEEEVQAKPTKKQRQKKKKMKKVVIEEVKNDDGDVVVVISESKTSKKKKKTSSKKKNDRKIPTSQVLIFEKEI